MRNRSDSPRNVRRMRGRTAATITVSSTKATSARSASPTGREPESTSASRTAARATPVTSWSTLQPSSALSVARVGATPLAAGDVDDDDARRQRHAETQEGGDLRAEACRHHHGAADRRRQDRLRGRREQQAAMFAPQMPQVDLDPDLEQQQHDSDVGEQLQLVAIGDVAGRERRDRQPHDEVADDRGQGQPSCQPAGCGRRQQHRAEFQDREGGGHPHRVRGRCCLTRRGLVPESEPVSTVHLRERMMCRVASRIGGASRDR